MLGIIVLVILFAATRPNVRAAGGTASWCAPTPTRCQSWGDGAMVGAVHSFKYGDTPYRVRVTAPSGRSVTVTVVSYCGCPGGRVIDLSPAAFVALAGKPHGLDQGLIRNVTVTRLAEKVPALPATDTE